MIGNVNKLAVDRMTTITALDFKNECFFPYVFRHYQSGDVIRI